MRFSRHLISQNFTLDGNFKANLFYKRDDGSDKALTDGRMYFPSQTEYDSIAETYVVREADKVNRYLVFDCSLLITT